MFIRGSVCIVLSAALLSCSRQPWEQSEPPEPKSFAVMTYHLDGLGEMDRDGDGISGEQKPQEEVDALTSILLHIQPDVLCLQGVGSAEDFRQLTSSLETGGLSFRFSEYVHTPASPMNIAMLSRFPLTEVTHHTNDVYSMGDNMVPVTHGYLETEVSVSPGYSFTLFNADLKSRDYHALGQTEMRRNEARMLGNHLRRILRRPNRPNLLVVGALHDRIQSAALRAVTGNDQEHLEDPGITDRSGDLWTWYDAEDESYRRADYVLVSPSMKRELLLDQSFILRSDEARLASGHRPVVARFSMKNIANDGPEAHHP